MKPDLKDFPKCEDCDIFKQIKRNSSRALICETARACGECPKDKWKEGFEAALQRRIEKDKKKMGGDLAYYMDVREIFGK